MTETEAQLLLMFSLILISFLCIFLVIHMKRTQMQLKKEVSKKYIKVNVILKNAVFEALEQARENHYDFEIRAYEKLLKDVKERL